MFSDKREVSLRSVSYRYSSDETALNQITLDIKPGEIALLCGSSGSGKSTVLRTMNGLIPHFHQGHLEGVVTVGDTDMRTTELQNVGRISATVFQNPRTQFFTTDVTSEMALTRQNYGDDPRRIMETIHEVAQRTGITSFLGRELSSLSGGELQRVACACALSAEARVILLDEPTSNLEAVAIDGFRALIGYLKKRNKTIVVAEHRVYYLRGLVDTVYRMDSGHIVEKMSGTEFFSQGDEERRARGLRSLRVTRPNLPFPSGKGLALTDIHFSYGRKPVLTIDSLTFPKGAITILAGPNGSGKTTLANIICGLLQPKSCGRFVLDSKKLDRSARQKDCTVVMQDVRRQLFSDRAIDELTLGLEPRQSESVDVEELLDALDLQGVRIRHPMALSGGQQQRVVIGAALACNKSVYIFDEPTSGVDYFHLRSIAQKLRDLKKRGVVVIVITHDPELIEECGDFLVDLSVINRNALPNSLSQKECA